jgi:hypothetical protein
MLKTVCALVCLTGAAHAEQKTVDVYQNYTFNWANYGVAGSGCENYLRETLDRVNIQRPFCAVDNIGRFLNGGWTVQYAEDIGYPVTPPNVQRWECRLFSVECLGKRFYLTRD